MRSLFTKRKAIVLLCLAGISLASWWAAQPRYQGKSMEWWFDQYLEDYIGSSYNHRLPLSEKQEEAIQAFREFGESGVPLLMRYMNNLVEEFNDDHMVYEILSSLPWNESRDFRREWIRRGEAAFDLLEKLGAPFEWVAKYGAAEEQNSTHKIAYLFELAFLHAATNRLDEVVRTVLPYIQKGNPRNYFSWRILSKTNLQAQAAIPYLLEKQDNLGRLSYQLMATLAPDSEEIRTLLEKNMHSETPRVAFHAALAITNVDGNQDLAARQIQSIFEKVLTMPDGDQQLQRSILRTLILWPYSIEALTPALMELGNKSDISMEQITEIFIDRQTDLSPLLPRIRRQLNKPLFPSSKFGRVEEKRIQLCLALLKQDFNNATA